jgi:hypothetical protein
MMQTTAITDISKARLKSGRKRIMEVRGTYQIIAAPRRSAMHNFTPPFPECKQMQEVNKQTPDERSGVSEQFI